jgi:RNA polymerase sigma factor (sigma-70 family)
MAQYANGLAARLRQLIERADTTPDAELLARFVAARDQRPRTPSGKQLDGRGAGDGEEAFAALVRRHGPMVHGVCRRVLGNAADADDAFQATFLVLARRAHSVRPRPLLGNWLYGVAYRTALEARRAAAVRRFKERRAAVTKTASTEDARSDDLREVLDRELAALPDTYRAAVVLCDLEGLSRRDAALRLGWPEGTLSGRLSRARSMLAARLSRRGLVLPAAGLGVVLESASAGLSAELVESTARIGILMSAGEVAVASAPVAALTEGVMKAMLLTKLKGVAMALVVGCAVLATTAASWQANAAGAGEGVAAGQAQRKPATDPDKARIAELERERDLLLKKVADLTARLEKLEGARDRDGALRDNELKLRVRGDERDVLLEKLRNLEEEAAKARAAGDRGAAKELAEKLEAELRLLEKDRAKLADPTRRTTAEDELKLKRLAEDRARLADPTTRGRLEDELKLKRLADERARLGEKVTGTGDRVSDLEDRVKQMEADLRKLLAEVERLRKR